MSGIYIEVADPFGVKLSQSDDFIGLQYARVVNDVGALVVELRPDTDVSLYRLDGRIGVWRWTAAGYALEMDTVWLIRKWQRALTESGERILRVTAYSANVLLERRIVAYHVQSAEGSKTAAADDMMKAIVRENLGALASDPARDWSALLSVAADASLAPMVSKEFGRRNVLTVLQELAAASAKAGTRLYFDVVTPTSGALEFRTMIGQRGVDHSASSPAPLVLSPERGTLAEGQLTDDYGAAASFIYAGGQGEEEARTVVEVEDTELSGASPFGRIERLRDARQASTADELQSEGETALRESRPVRLFSGRISETPQARYGVDWGWGDRVAVVFERVGLTCHVSAVQVMASKGAETVTATLSVEESVEEAPPVPAIPS